MGAADKVKPLVRKGADLHAANKYLPSFPPRYRHT
jgi:hypothetical protein